MQHSPDCNLGGSKRAKMTKSALGFSFQYRVKLMQQNRDSAFTKVFTFTAPILSILLKQADFVFCSGSILQT